MLDDPDTSHAARDATEEFVPAVPPTISLQVIITGSVYAVSPALNPRGTTAGSVPMVPRASHSNLDPCVARNTPTQPHRSPSPSSTLPGLLPTPTNIVPYPQPYRTHQMTTCAQNQITKPNPKYTLTTSMSAELESTAVTQAL